MKEKCGRTTKHRSGLEWSFKVSIGCLPEYMNSDDLCVIQVLHAHEGLDKERLSVLHVDVEEGHHGDTKVRAAELEHMGSGWKQVQSKGIHTSFEVSERS